MQTIGELIQYNIIELVRFGTTGLINVLNAV